MKYACVVCKNLRTRYFYCVVDPFCRAIECAFQLKIFSVCGMWTCVIFSGCTSFYLAFSDYTCLLWNSVFSALAKVSVVL